LLQALREEREWKKQSSFIFHFAKGFLAKNVLMTAQRDFRLGNSLLNMYLCVVWICAVVAFWLMLLSGHFFTEHWFIWSYS